jgi:glycosyltransferase involved in cell wall biosynthesis
MKVSVVIPTFERQEATLQALRSALAQTLPPLEVIVVDDGSKIPFRLPPGLDGEGTVRVLRQEENRGAAAARNAGVAAAKGEWIAFLDSDDLWAKDKLARQTEYAAAHPGHGPACYATAFQRRDAVRKGGNAALLPRGADTVGAFASGCWFAPGSTALMRREVFAAVGPFDEELRRLEDLDWFLRFALAGGELKVAPFVGSLVRVGGRPAPGPVEAASRALREKWSGGGGKPTLGSRERRRLAAYLDLECAAANRYAGNFWRAAAFLACSWIRVPRFGIALADWWRTVGTRGTEDGFPAL